MALPARKLEEQESEESIRQAWRMRLKSGINVISRHDLEPEQDVPPSDEAGMRAAWQGRSRADTETAQASKTNRPRTDIQPTPSLPIQPGQEKKEIPEQTDESRPEADRTSLWQEPLAGTKPAQERQESKFARWLRKKQRAKRQARAKEYEAAGASGAVKGTMKRYKQIKKFIRVLRAGSLVGTSLGDVFFSLSALFLSLVGEWLISKFIPAYQLFPKDDPFVIFDKALWYVGWAVVGSALLIIAIWIILLYYISQDPTNALRLITS